MKISQFISVLEDLKQAYGDKYIWSMDDLDGPCPSKFEVELTSKLKRTECGISGGKSGTHKRIEVTLEYEGGVDLIDRSFDDMCD